MCPALFAAFAVASLLSGSPAAGGSLAELTGDWEGVVANEGTGIPLVLHLSEEEGRIRASLDSPVQGAFGLEVTHTRLKAGRFSFRVPAVGGGFRGELLAEASEIRGTWHQGGAKLPLTFRRQEASAGGAGRRPQEPRPPFPYASEDLTFALAAQGETLSGTLTLPPTAGVHPARVLVSGSGPQGRDTSLFGHRPFRVIADHRSRRGDTVLRFEDRLGRIGAWLARQER